MMFRLGERGGKMLAEHPKMVVFDSLTCCSLRCAYHNPEHSLVLQALGELLGSAHWIDVFGGIFERTARLGFIPNAKTALFYGTLARNEAESLNAGDERLPCGHTKIEHYNALEYVSTKFPVGQTN